MTKWLSTLSPFALLLLASCARGDVNFSNKAAWSASLSDSEASLLIQAEAYLVRQRTRMTFTLACPTIRREGGRPIVEFYSCLKDTTATAYRVYFDERDLPKSSEEIVPAREVMPN